MRKLSLLISSIFIFFNVSICQSVESESLQSLLIQINKNDTILGTATGFVIERPNNYYLITNWHVVTNKSPFTKKWLDTLNQIEPNKIIIQHRSLLGVSEVVYLEELLIDNDGKKAYKEFYFEKKLIDVVAIPLKKTTSNNVRIYPVEYQLNYEKLSFIRPNSLATVIGYPRGTNENYFPVWKSGIIASEPQFNQQNLPIIYLDLLGIGGMSGSPVYYKSNITSSPEYISFNTKSTFFIGVHSSTLNDLKLGMIFKASFLKGLFDNLP